MPRRPALLVALALALAAGCAELPDFDAAGAGAGAGLRPAPAGYPALLPLGVLLARAEGLTLDPAIESSLASRAAGLRGRAQALRRPVIEAATRARMAAAARRLGGG